MKRGAASRGPTCSRVTARSSRRLSALSSRGPGATAIASGATRAPSDDVTAPSDDVTAPLRAADQNGG